MSHPELIENIGIRNRKICYDEIVRHKLKIVILVNSDLADKLGVVVLPSIPFGPSVLGALRVFLRLLPEPRKTAAGNPGAPPSAWRFAEVRQAAQTHRR